MRGLFNALLLAPAVAIAHLPDHREEAAGERRPSSYSSSQSLSWARIHLEPSAGPRSRHDAFAPVLTLDVLPSQEICGYANLTINGQQLSQTLKDDVSTGKGLISINEKSSMFAQWSFHCVKVNAQPDALFLKFIVDAIDGKPKQDVGFTALFKQSDEPEVVHVSTDLSLPDQIAANPDLDDLLPANEELLTNDMDAEMEELEWMYAQLHELERMIHEKKHSIAKHAHQPFTQEIRDCDSIRCVMATVVQQVKHTAETVFDKIASEHGFDPHSEMGKHHRPAHHKQSKHHDHDKQPNHDCPSKGNHTRPPYHKRPHKFLPICRLPPHHGPPHFRHRPGPEFPPPPHHKGKHGGDSYPPPPPHHDHDHDGEDRPEDERPHHGGAHHGFDHPPPPPPPPPPHHDGPHHLPPPPSPHYENNDHEDGTYRDEHGPPSPQGGLPFDREVDPDAGFIPHHGGDHRNPIDLEEGPEHFSENAHILPFDHPGPPGPPHGRHGPGKAVQVVKYTAIGFLVAFLLLALHRRCSSKAFRAARREKKQLRRAYRRSAHKHIISRLLARMSGDSDHDSSDYQEKREALLSDPEAGMSNTMAEEITELRNSAEVMGEVAAATFESRTEVQPSNVTAPTTTPMCTFDLITPESGEQLPAYEDDEREGSMVSDGFRPGSVYTPSESSGGADDILGDIKQ